MRWWDRRRERKARWKYFYPRHVVIVVGTKQDGTWQAVGGTGIEVSTAAKIVTLGGATHLNYVEAEVWTPGIPTPSGETASLEAAEVSERPPPPLQQHPLQPTPGAPAAAEPPLPYPDPDRQIQRREPHDR